MLLSEVVRNSKKVAKVTSNKIAKNAKERTKQKPAKLNLILHGDAVIK